MLKWRVEVIVIEAAKRVTSKSAETTVDIMAKGSIKEIDIEDMLIKF